MEGVSDKLEGPKYSVEIKQDLSSLLGRAPDAVLLLEWANSLVALHPMGFMRSDFLCLLSVAVSCT